MWVEAPLQQLPSHGKGDLGPGEAWLESNDLLLRGRGDECGLVSFLLAKRADLLRYAEGRERGLGVVDQRTTGEKCEAGVKLHIAGEQLTLPQQNSMSGAHPRKAELARGDVVQHRL